MIIVDIVVEAFDKSYDFKLDETVSISKIVEEICEMLTQKEKSTPVKSVNGLILCRSDNGVILSPNMTLGAYHIVSGDKLLLV